MAADEERARGPTGGEAPRTVFGIPIGLAVAIAVFAATIVAMVIAVAVLRAPGA